MIGMMRLNNFMFSRASTTVRLNGLMRINGLDAIEWADEVPQELVGGMNNGGPPLGKTRGAYTCSASMTFYEDEASTFMKLLALQDPTLLGDLAKINFQIGIALREEIRVSTVILANCTLKGRTNSVGNDANALTKVVPLQPQMIIQDGLSLVSLVPAL